MRVLMLGDIVGKPGRYALNKLLPAFREAKEIDFIIANGENSAGGSGITSKVMKEFFSYGVDVITSGNHVWRNREIYSHLDTEARLLRPANYPPGLPGKGLGIFEVKESGMRVAVINLLGRFNLESVDCPFREAQKIINELPEDVNIVFVDFHAETTSEKKAMGWFLDGKISGIAGTHTHVQTNDAQLLHLGTGYLTDLGMCGVEASVLGLRPQLIIDRYLYKIPTRFELAEGEAWMCGAVFTVDETSGKCSHVELVRTPVVKTVNECDLP